MKTPTSSPVPPRGPRAYRNGRNNRNSPYKPKYGSPVKQMQGGNGTKEPEKYAQAESSPGPMEVEGAWQTWPEFTVWIDNLPVDITTTNLWDWFSDEGEIVYMDINEGRSKNGTMSAKIRFEPPPKRAFWANGNLSVQHPDGQRYPRGLTVLVNPARVEPQGWMRSPVSAERFFPIKMTLHPLSLQFGSMVGPAAMKAMRTLSTTSGATSLSIEVNLRFKRITVFFPMEVVSEIGRYVRQHKINIDFSRMKKAYQTALDDGNSAIILPLQLPPEYYWRKHDARDTFSDDVKNWNVTEAWYRATDIVENVDLPLNYPVALHTDLNDPGYIDIARWTTFRFVLDGQSEEARILNHQLKTILDDFNITTTICDDFEVTTGGPAAMWNHIEHPSTSAHEGNATSLLQLSSLPVTQLEFEVRYQLEVCISRGILNEHTISAEFLQTLASMPPLKAKLHLEYLADQEEPLLEPMQVFKDAQAEAYYPRLRIPYYCALVRKAVVTPTSIRYSTPAVETSNRVMRKYSTYQDRFLRIQFVNETEQGRITINKDQNDEVWKRVVRTLYKGIRIGDRLYEFLAFGSSQLRQCGAYFFCPTAHVSCDDIRKWMGHVNHIKNIAKYAARLGQCFSTTREIRGISVPTIYPIDDIERNGYCFTDGVGKISPFVAQLVIEEMTLDIFDRPSAFQFRMGGCKGILAVWPNAKGTEVHVRESQEKFKADFNGLEIIRCAGFATATLNRQTITILESLGVPIDAFTTLLDEQLKSYEDAMINNHMAVELLTKFVDQNQTTLAIAELLKGGFKSYEIQEPFVVNVVSLWRAWSLKLLKEKARIVVEKSAFLLGCVDETNTLRGHSTATEKSSDQDPNKLPQIFVQITDSTRYNKTTIISGVCIVGRNPSLHPGDIRVVQAVDNPKLHHLKDVVVFSQQGDRPVPNMLSGGDLDGDDFFVIWDKKLIPKIWNYEPMDYAGPKPQQLDRDVNVDDLRNFFVTYLKNDKLPLIATSHLAFADSERGGPKSRKCIELAHLHSKAVDYPKTGEAATMRRDQSPHQWPHFMEKKNSYHSHKALGQIYDKVVRKTIQFNPIWDSPFDERITKRFELDTETLKAARKIKLQYDTSVRRLLSQHDLKTEFELWSGFAMSKPAIGGDYKQSEDLGREYDALKHRFRDMCYEAAGGRETEQLDRFVAAMYTVTEEQTKIALYEHNRGPINDAGNIIEPRRLEPRSMPLISFPWIFYWVLVRVALKGEYNPSKSLLAAARRTTHKHQPPAVKQPEEAVSETNGDTTVSKNAGEAHLPDGRVIHLGQPLALFHPEEEDEEEIADEDRSAGEAVASVGLEGCRDVDGGGGGEEDVDGAKTDAASRTALTEETSKLEEVEEVQKSEAEVLEAEMQEAEEESALDRLAKLMGM
ncbi:hypothetical protein G7046_g4667 [Stylonectria norvegica]|nr:hypothetical protein G7046_g4667 [Stylonectria norvegica]